MAITFDTDFNGAADTALTTAYPCDVGSIVLITPQIPGSVNELNGSSYLRMDGTGFTAASFDMSPAHVNGTVTLRVRTGTAGTASTFAFLFKVQAGGNFYALQIYSGTTGVTLDTFVSGAADTQLAAHGTGYTANTDYTFTLVISGDTFSVWRDGLLIIPPVSDSAYTTNLNYSAFLFNDSNATQTIVDRITIDDAVVSLYPKNHNQDPRRALKRTTRSRLFKAA